MSTLHLIWLFVVINKIYGQNLAITPIMVCLDTECDKMNLTFIYSDNQNYVLEFEQSTNRFFHPRHNTRIVERYFIQSETNKLGAVTTTPSNQIKLFTGFFTFGNSLFNLFYDATDSTHYISPHIWNTFTGNGSGMSPSYTMVSKLDDNSPRPAREEYYIRVLVASDDVFRAIRTPEESRQFYYELINSVNAVTRRIGINLVIVGYRSFSPDNLVNRTGSGGISTYLNLIRDQNSNRVWNGEPYDLLLGITGHFYADGPSQLYLGGLCSNDSVMITSTNYGTTRSFTPSYAMAVAHSIGHLFGLGHPPSNNTACGCDSDPNGECVMGSRHQNGITGEWSPCTKQHLRMLADDRKIWCAFNKPTTLDYDQKPTTTAAPLITPSPTSTTIKPSATTGAQPQTDQEVIPPASVSGQVQASSTEQIGYTIGVITIIVAIALVIFVFSCYQLLPKESATH